MWGKKKHNMNKNSSDEDWVKQKEIAYFTESKLRFKTNFVVT